MKKLLQQQLHKNTAGAGMFPGQLSDQANNISTASRGFAKNRGMKARSADTILEQLTAQNARLKKENDDLKDALIDLNAIVENIDEVLYSVDIVTRKHTVISASCKKVFGYGVSDFITDEALWQKLIHPGDRHIAKLNDQQMRRGKQVLNQYRIIHKDGSTRWVENKIIPSLDKKGELVGINGIVSDITGRRQMEQELEKSFSLLEATLESTTDGILVVDINAGMVQVNKKFTEQWRIPPEILNSGDSEVGIAFVAKQLISPEEFIAKIKELNTRQKDLSFDILKFRDGRVFERYSQPRLIKGKYVGRIWSFRDVTAQENAIAALKESEKRLIQIIDLVPHFIFAKDAAGKFILVNEACANAYGTTVENLIGKSDADFNSEKKVIEQFLQDDLALFNSGTAKYNIEETIRDHAGNTRILSTTKIPYTSGGIASVLGVSVDISERKKAETILKENRARLLIATRIAKLGYWELDVLNGSFTFNDQFYAIFRTSTEKVGGNTMTAKRYAELFVHPDDGPIVETEIAAAINTTDPDFSRQVEHRIIYADGETGYISVHFYIVKDGNGRTIKAFGVNQDITDRKKVEETLLSSEASLELKNKELGLKNKELEQFAYVASHDLQEPLRTISSFVNLVQEQYYGRLDKRSDKYFDYISQASDRMKVLIKDLLDFSRIGAKVELKKIDCNIILQNMLADIMVAIREAKADIQYTELPVIYGYPTEIKLLFQNLVVNAIKFRNKDKSPQIKISAQKKGNYWEFAVSDNGIGIEKEHSERIFDIFQRLHTRREYAGSGIGLSHCKKIVELHHGKIRVESTPGKGSTFYFTLLIKKDL